MADADNKTTTAAIAAPKEPEKKSWYKKASVFVIDKILGPGAVSTFIEYPALWVTPKSSGIHKTIVEYQTKKTAITQAAVNWITTPNGNKMHDTLLEYSDDRAGFRSTSLILGCVPVVGNVAAVICEGGGIYAGLRDGKEDWKKVWAEGLVGMAISAVPFGKAAVGFSKIGLKVAAKSAEKAGVEATEKIIVKEVEKAATESLAPLTEKGFSTSGKFWGLSYVELKALEKETGEVIAKKFAEHGYQFSAHAAEKLVKSKIFHRIIADNLIRGGIHLSANMAMDYFCEDNKLEEGHVVAAANDLCEKNKKINKDAKSYGDLDDSGKEIMIRETYNKIRAKGVEIIDKSGKPVSADEVVKDSLGHIPSKETTMNYEIPAIMLADYRQKQVQSQSMVTG
jgi:hypothetical protein